jgi:hypothetical protein
LALPDDYHQVTDGLPNFATERLPPPGSAQGCAVGPSASGFRVLKLLAGLIGAQCHLQRVLQFVYFVVEVPGRSAS